MAQRRVVTEEVGGRSRVASDGPAGRLALSGDTGVDELWISAPDEQLGHDPRPDDAALTPPPGSLHWRIFTLPPDAVVYGAPRAGDARIQADEVDEQGWHRTGTLDYDLILDGDVTLVLDDGEVDLHPGDCVVQRQTNHAWRNRGTRPVRIMAVMLGVPA